MAFALFAFGVAAFHFRVLVRNGEPSGLDFGNWLTIGHHWLGTGAPGGSTSTYPPVVPLLAVGAVQLFGIPVGTSIVAAVAGLAPAVACYRAVVANSSRVAAVCVGVAIAVAGSTGEAVAWGGVPQLLGLGFGLSAMHSFVAFLHEPRRSRAWMTGVLIGITGATTHLVVAQIAVCLVVALGLHLVLVRDGVAMSGPWFGRDGNTMHLVRLAVPILPLLPLYVQLSGSVGESFLSRTSPAVSVKSTLDAFAGLYTDSPLLWKSLMIVALVAPFVLWRSRRNPLWLLTVAILVTDVVSVALTGEDRLAYLAPLGIACGLGLVAGEFVASLPRGGAWISAIVVCLVAAVAVEGGVRHFSAQRTYYGERLLPAGTTVALDWVREHTPPRSLIAVAPVDSLPFGWWVEGYGHRATLTGASELYLNFPAERERARKAISLFSLTDVSGAQFAQEAEGLGVAYLYVPAGWWSGIPGTSLERYIDANPSSVVFKNRAALIVKVG